MRSPPVGVDSVAWDALLFEDLFGLFPLAFRHYEVEGTYAAGVVSPLVGRSFVYGAYGLDFVNASRPIILYREYVRPNPLLLIAENCMILLLPGVGPHVLKAFLLELLLQGLYDPIVNGLLLCGPHRMSHSQITS